MTETPTHPTEDAERDGDRSDDSADSPAEQAKVREGEMEESGEENAA